MKQVIKRVSILMVISILFNVLSPAAFAAIPENASTPTETINLHKNGSYYYGTEDAEKRYSFQIEPTASTGYVVVIYLDNPDYMYECYFTLPEGPVHVDSPKYWNSLLNLCLSNSDDWVKSYLPSVVMSFSIADTSPATARSDEYGEDDFTEEFEAWLHENYGPEYAGRYLAGTGQDGIPMQLKYGRNLETYLDRPFVLNAAMTVTAFATAYSNLFGLAVLDFVDMLLSLVDSSGILEQGQKVYKYVLRILDYRYVLVDDSHYPYSMATKQQIFTGVGYSKSGNTDIDEDYVDTTYSPSESYYNSYTAQFNAAYSEYLRIGWQEGDFP